MKTSEQPSVSLRSTEHWLIRSKLAPPHYRESMIERTHLLEQLLELESGCVVLLNAPAGYGKTAILTQWHRVLRARGRVAAWLTLTEDDDEPMTLLAYMAAALSTAGLPLWDLSRTLLDGIGLRSTRNAIQALLRAVEISDRRVIFILEDVHRLRSDRTEGVLRTLLERLPRHATFCISSRSRPSLPLASLRARGRLLYLGIEDLRFSLDEVLTCLTPAVTWPVAQALYEQTEGWPVALQLAQVNHSTHVQASLPRLGRNPQVAQYLAEQVVAGQPEDVRRTMLAMSVLERMNGALVNCLSGRDDGWQILEQLETANLCLSLDSENAWYRFHPLIAEYLRHRLERTDAQAGSRLHRLAADWFFGQGAYQDALRHASRSGDSAFLVQTLERAGGWRAALRGGPTMLSMLRELNPTIPAPFPRLRLGRIYTMIIDHRLIDAARSLAQLRGELATEGHSQLLTPELAVDMTLIELLLRSYQDAPLQTSAIEALERECLSSTDTEQAAVFAEWAAHGRYCTGHFVRGAEIARLAQDFSHAGGVALVELYCCYFEGACELEYGRLDAAQEAFDKMLSTSLRLGGPDGGLARIARVFLAEVAFERGDDALVASLLPTIGQLDGVDGWCDLFVSFFNTMIELTPSASAAQFLQQARDLARRLNLPRVDRAATLASLRRVISHNEPRRTAEQFRAAVAIQADDDAFDWRSRMPVAIGRAELALWNDSPKEALHTLDTIFAVLLDRKHLRLLCRARLLSACAHGRLLNRDALHAALFDAVELGAQHGLVRPFLDYAPLMNRIALSALAQLTNDSAPRGSFAAEMSQRIAALRGATPDQSTGFDLLSPRERTLLQLIAEGQTNKEAAIQLGVSVNTVATHRKNLYRKLDSSTRSRVIAAARSRGLL